VTGMTAGSEFAPPVVLAAEREAAVLSRAQQRLVFPKQRIAPSCVLSKFGMTFHILLEIWFFPIASLGAPPPMKPLAKSPGSGVAWSTIGNP